MVVDGSSPEHHVVHLLPIQHPGAYPIMPFTHCTHSTMTNEAQGSFNSFSPDQWPLEKDSSYSFVHACEITRLGAEVQRLLLEKKV